MIRAVLDTNVLISGVVFGGVPGKLLDHFAADEYSVVYCAEILTELRRIIRSKFPSFEPELALLQANLAADAEKVLLGDYQVDICRDPNDNAVIEAALAGRCNYIVSGDKDLLVLKKFRDVRIVSPKAFFKMLLSRNLS